MILKKIYEEDTHTQKVWYDSTMIYYTEMVEDEYSNKGDLYVTFKNGTTYRYKDVKLEDYVLFVGGGTDASQGKTLNKVIKGKYEVTREPDADMELLKEAYEHCYDDKKDVMSTYFISGHRDLTEEEFEFYYAPLINVAMYRTPDAKFIVGDYHGCDIMAQNYLLDILGVEPSRVTVYHMGDAPMNVNPSVVKLKGGFNDDEERDAAMTKASFEDIARVRSHTDLSGTAQNILRRYRM